jgi:hypothetical protein
MFISLSRCPAARAAGATIVSRPPRGAKAPLKPLVCLMRGSGRDNLACMMRRSGAFWDVGVVLEIAVAAFLITLGLAGLLNWDSGLTQVGRDSMIAVVVAIVELVAGVLVLFGAFTSVQTRLLSLSTLVIAILWALRILFGFFGRDLFAPDFVVWLNRLSADLIVLLALWMVNRKYA